MQDEIRLIAQSEAGAIYHDDLSHEWLIDIASKGIMLSFDQAEYRQFIELLRGASQYIRDLDCPPSHEPPTEADQPR